ncbi:hypothetical protein [Kribbella shirazensis]|uniref:Uncharacterized protein n=1 Tax=Kribbella shirazensis TaxID=1105143 RepID=A0A7X5VD89_9ACTN|nr:hypothetical protein [Kribbella shirazensis]NIK58208.1 hypothetical protein [Kribbella shirazensis]
MVRLVVAEDSYLIRAGLELLVATQPDWELACGRRSSLVLAFLSITPALLRAATPVLTPSCHVFCEAARSR